MHVMPPSLKRDFATKKITEKTAEKVLLSNEDTHIWLEHLATIMNNRKRGATKAAATRRKRAAAILIPQVLQSLPFLILWPKPLLLLHLCLLQCQLICVNSATLSTVPAQLLSGLNVMDATTGTVHFVRVWRESPHQNYIYAGVVVKGDK